MDSYLDGTMYLIEITFSSFVCHSCITHQLRNQKPVDSNVSTFHAAVGHLRKIIYHVPSQKEELEERTLERFICSSFVTAKF